MSHVFQKAELLEESPEATVHNDEVEKLEQKIRHWSTQSDNKLVAYLGNFGSGKSATLNKVKSKTKQKYYWLNFEIWRYPDRQQIWDGFAIEVINKLRNDKKGELLPRKLIKKLVKVGDQVEGVSPLKTATRYWQKALSSRWITLPIVLAVWFSISLYIWSVLHEATSTWTRFPEALIKYSVPLLFVAFAFLGVANLLPKVGRPLRRVFELEGVLYDVLTKYMDKPLIVVVEDVDRCKEDEGLVFLETLRHFLKDVWTPADGKGKPVIVIAPQEYSNFDIFDDEESHSYERSIKVYDLPLYFGRSKLNPDDVGEFLTNLKIVDEYRDVLRATVTELTNGYGEQTSMRKLKFMLREMDDFCDANPTANPSIAFVLIFAQNTKIDTERTVPYRGSEYLDGHHTIHNTRGDDGYQWHVFADMLYNVSGEGKVIQSFNIEYPNLEGEIEIWRHDQSHPNVITIALDEKYKELVERA